VLRDARLPTAPVCRAVPAPRSGVLGAPDVRALGVAVVMLGGGRRRPGEPVDARVGLSGVRAPGEAVRAGEPLAWVHAADAAGAALAAGAVARALPVVDAAPPVLPLVRYTLRG
jgi:thymidine phosphorylase